MGPRVLLLVLAIIGVVLILRWFLRSAPEDVARRIRQGLLFAAIGVLVLLAATGRLHWLYAAIGALIPVAQRLMTLMGYWGMAKRFKNQQQNPKQPPPGQGQESRRPASGSSMTPERAREVLGVDASASREDIIRAHKRLMQRMHPDQGGSDYLAAEINQARDVLLGK